jgi:hypothetical protein
VTSDGSAPAVFFNVGGFSRDVEKAGDKAIFANALDPAGISTPIAR